jgi:hypothetical protein
MVPVEVLILRTAHPKIKTINGEKERMKQSGNARNSQARHCGTA